MSKDRGVTISPLEFNSEIAWAFAIRIYNVFCARFFAQCADAEVVRKEPKAFASLMVYTMVQRQSFSYHNTEQDRQYLLKKTRKLTLESLQGSRFSNAPTTAAELAKSGLIFCAVKKGDRRIRGLNLEEEHALVLQLKRAHRIQDTLPCKVEEKQDEDSDSDVLLATQRLMDEFYGPSSMMLDDADEAKESSLGAQRGAPVERHLLDLLQRKKRRTDGHLEPQRPSERDDV